MDKVLIVDNDLQLLTILTETLKKYRNKFVVVTEKDGLAAIKALQQQTISLVVTEVKLPKVNGLVLLAYMAKNFPKTPCIIITDHGTQSLRKRLLQESSPYIEKPFKIPDLAQTIMSLLGKREILGGTLNGVSVAGFLKLMEMEYMTCLCEITPKDSEKGYLLFDDGLLYNAFYQNIRGEKAALKLLRLDGVTIRFRKPPKQKIPRSIKSNLSDLLAKAIPL